MTSFAPVKLSTDDLPVANRQEAIREHYGRIMQRMEYSPGGEGEVFIHSEALPLKGVALARGLFSSLIVERTPDLLTDGQDDVMLCRIPTGGRASLPTGENVEFAPGDFFLGALNYRLNIFLPESLGEPTVMFQMSRSVLGGLADVFDDRPLRRLPSGMPELQLLLAYGRSAMQTPLDSPTLQQSVSGHLVDLATLAIGASREAGEIAARRGVRAAQLAVAKREALNHLANPNLTAPAFAAMLRISTRYLHLLFESADTTFSGYIMQQRLIRARDLLIDPRRFNSRIIDIALEVGFREVRTFNGAFRQRYGMTPSEMREQAVKRG